MAFSVTPPAVALGIALALSLALTPVLRAAALRWGLIDRPNARSSHQAVVPRGGGTAIALSVLAALWLASPGRALDHGAVPVLLGGVALALIGLADDRASLSAFTRLLAQLGVAGLVVQSVGSFERIPLPALLEHHLGPLSAAVTILWIVAVVNIYNFLDGIDGLAAVQAIVTGVGVLLAGWGSFSALLAAALVGASAGFLPFNWSKASVFLGDVGSYFLGYVLAVLPLLAPRELRSQAALFVAVSLWLFLADATWTLAARALRGERLYEAHREHLYQRLSQRWGHARVTTAIGAGSVVLTAAALLWWRTQAPRWAWVALGLGLALFAVEWSLARSASPAPKAALRWPALRAIAGGRRLVFILGLDALLILCSFYAASLLRFDGHIPEEHQQILRRFLPLFLAIRLSLHLGFGLHRWSFRLSGFYEAVRVVVATAVGTVAFVAVFYFLQTPGPPRSVLAMEFFLTASLVGAFRFSPRLANNWLLAQSRLRSGQRIRTLIVGAGSAGDLLLRDLLRSDEHSYEVVGFVDDDPHKWGQWIGGQPVLGPIDHLPALAKSRDVQQLLFAIPRLPAARLREILGGLLQPEAQLQDPARLVRLPERPRAALDAARPLARPPAAAARGALRRAGARRADPRPPHPGDRGGRLDRQRGLPADRRPRARLAGARRHRREQPLLPVPPPATPVPGPGSRGAGGGHPRRAAPRPARAALPPAGRDPRGRAQARAADGVRAGGGGEEQRARLPERGGDGRARWASSASCSSRPTRPSTRRA